MNGFIMKGYQVSNSKDNVTVDLIEIIKDSRITGLNGQDILSEDLLMQKLVSYFVRRDIKVFNRAYTMGKESIKNESLVKGASNA